MTTAQAGGAQWDRWWLVVAAGLAVFMASLEASIVTIALPSIDRDLDLATSTTEWVVLAYLVPLATLPAIVGVQTLRRRPALPGS